MKLSSQNLTNKISLYESVSRLLAANVVKLNFSLRKEVIFIMTKNQLDYLGLEETKRNNVVVAAETNRHNIAGEGETKRHNLVTETQARNELKETTRTHKANEKENKRHNKATEKLGNKNYKETVRHDKATEKNAQVQTATQAATARYQADSSAAASKYSADKSAYATRAASTNSANATLKAKEIERQIQDAKNEVEKYKADANVDAKDRQTLIKHSETLDKLQTDLEIAKKNNDQKTYDRIQRSISDIMKNISGLASLVGFAK